MAERERCDSYSVSGCMQVLLQGNMSWKVGGVEVVEEHLFGEAEAEGKIVVR